MSFFTRLQSNALAAVSALALSIVFVGASVLPAETAAQSVSLMV